MKWIKWGTDKIGDVKDKSEFLFLPKCINTECRWFETARYQTKFEESMHQSVIDGTPVFTRSWVEQKWIN